MDFNNVSRYYLQVIVSFRDKETKRLFQRQRSRAVPADLRRAALRKLLILDGADTLDDLRVPPGNRLEKLRGDRAGQNSIRVNQRYRICFVWQSGNAELVEIVDYH